MWRQMIPHLSAAVIGPRDDKFLGRVPVVTQHVVSVISADTEDEAHYLCAMLNSSVATAISASYSTGKSFGTPSMLDHVNIPRFVSEDSKHKRLVALSREAHNQATSRSVLDVDEEVNAVAAHAFGVNVSYLEDLNVFASSLRGTRLQQALPDLEEA
jgi:hypothetical protein